MSTWLNLYRVSAYVVGTLLLALTAGMVVKYTPIDDPTLVSVFGPIHGFLYPLYLLATLNLGIRSRWEWPYILGIMLAGTIPFLSFYAERKVTRRVRSAAAISPKS